ncbi:MAG TPA: MFS transporter [Terriglobia bacterium]|nr:MFS transporter [Terriglobia bacterium]
MIQWRKNQFAITISAALIFFGYTLVMPFLPSFVRELGITSKAGVAFWSGLILSCSPLVASLCGPIWGRIGDRWGLRMMAQRATVANALLWFSMGFAQDVYQLLALRALLGLLGGFNSVSVALITQAAPREKVPQVVGTLQSVQILAAGVGPFAGGILANIIGVRYTFFVTGIVMLGSVVSVFWLYRDSPGNNGNPQPAKGAAGFWRRPQFFTAMLVLFFINMADRTFGLTVPLFLEELGTAAAWVAGAVISLATFGEAASAWMSGKLASRVGALRLISVRLFASIAVLVPMIYVHSTLQFSILRVLLALLAGGMLTLTVASASDVIPEEYRGTGFALLQSTSMLGGAAGPLVAGGLAGWSIRSVFLFNAVVYALMVLFLRRNVRR